MSTKPGARFHPLNHFDYDVLDEQCCCLLCEDYRRKHALYSRAQAKVEKHHRSCMCPGCKTMRRAHTQERAADERRTLYSELSWLSSRDPMLGAPVMEWITKEIADPSRGDGWWEGRAPYYPILHWINSWSAAFYAAASGASGLLVAMASGA